MTELTPKQKLIEIVRNRIKTNKTNSKTNMVEYETAWDAGYQFACKKFLKDIEEILP